ncbi:ABC transporter permease [Candidatus Phytoplasma pruni]|uniref:ABC transporter permease n=1 Tax=Candidatus Phytoplasma pruni TaxID=479893 RepID=UPI001FD2989A|nr:ABC transporter permease [Candidatus Phytoplasma pruni]
MLIGSFLGVISGYFGGIIDNIINFICDILVVVPDVILAILLLIFLPKNAYTLVIVLSITNIPSFIRLIRGKTLSITEKDFIKSAEALGATKTRIIFKHIIPNLRDTLITRFVVGMSTIILTISGLGFIGLGVDASKPEWGNILGSAKENIRFHPHIFYGPFIIISLTSLSFNLIGKGLISYFDPKQKK